MLTGIWLPFALLVVLMMAMLLTSVYGWKLERVAYRPLQYTLHTYGAIQAWAQAVEKAGSTDLIKVVATLRSSKFDTVLGNIGFDGKGDVTAPGYVRHDWKNGTYDYR